jgi:hypothetical protein
MRLRSNQSRFMTIEALETRTAFAADTTNALLGGNGGYTAESQSLVTNPAVVTPPMSALLSGLGTQNPLFDPRVPIRPFEVDFQWRMNERTGPDYQYGFGLGLSRGDLPNVRDYVNPRGYEVTLDASASTTPFGTHITSFAWTIEGRHNGSSFRRLAHGRTPTVMLPEGQYTVSLTVTNSLQQRATATGKINVDNILIVSVGDSYASGEGIPQGLRDIENFWAFGGDVQSTLDNQRAHRSIHSAPAQAAYMIEQSDPHTSVTFVSMAVTGASLDEIQEQVEQVRKLTQTSTGQREIDVLYVSGGGNDLKFASIIKELLLHDEGESLSVPKRWADEGLWSLNSKYNHLKRTVASSLNVDPSHVFVTGYPDPTLDRGPDYVPDAVMDDVSTLDGYFPVGWEEIDANEIRWARENVIHPLNITLERIATSSSIAWNFVDLEYVLQGHGYNAADNWVVTWTESMDVQGNVGTIREPLTMGVMHPNAKGARAMAQEMVDAVFESGAIDLDRELRFTGIVRRDPPIVPPLFGQQATYSIEVQLNRQVVTSSFTSEDVTILGPDGKAVRIVGVQPTLAVDQWHRFRITFVVSKFGNYRLRIGSAVVDGRGNRLDQDRDGINGHIANGVDKDVYSTTFAVASSFGDRFA